MQGAREEKRPGVRATRVPLNPVLVAKQQRPKGYWKHKYIEKQEAHPEKEQALKVAQRGAAGRVPKPYAGRTLATLHPPPAPGLFQRDWLRSLLCEGCGLPATTNTTKCLHCNVVVHDWCRDLAPPGVRCKRSGRRASSIAPQRQQPPQQQQQSKLTQAQKHKNHNTLLDWVCWECQEDMMLDLQYYRRLKNRQMGANVERRAAGKIIRFISWVADNNNAIKAERRAIMIQSFVRMRVAYVRFRRWAESQKRAMIVSVRAASGLPVGDPISRKCHPYIILTVVEKNADDPSERVETISRRLQTKKGGDTGPSITPAAAAAIAHTHSHHHPRHGGGGARKHPAGSKEKTFSFQWDEELLLPGVSDSSTIVFTVLHQAPTKVVCLGQALVEPKRFKRNEEHVRTVSLAKQQVAVPSGPRYRGEEAKMATADWAKPGNLTFTMKKSSYCDAYCTEVNGPIIEEINTLALAESQEERLRDKSGPVPAAGNAHNDPHASTATAAVGKPKRDSHGSKRRHHSGGSDPAEETPATSPQTLSPSGTDGGTNASRAHMNFKAGDLSTVWWACAWQRYLRVYRHLGDSHPKLTLPLDRWSLIPVAEGEEEEDSASERTTSRDLRLFCACPKRWLVLRCATKTDRQRWEEVIAKNQRSEEVITKNHAGNSATPRKTRRSMLDQAASH